MRTTGKLKQMNYDELTTEETEAYEYWRKVVAFKAVALALEEYE